MKAAMSFRLKLRLLLTVAFLDPLVSGQTGFLSIDCGANESYTDSAGIQWISDDGYTQMGSKEAVQNILLRTAQPRNLQTLRSFPEIKRKYCYVLSSLENGTRYLLRASFSYGNYDNLNSPPTFDLLLDSNYWVTISFRNQITSLTLDPDIKEIIYMAKSNSISVCLGRTTNGIPVISSLEIRPALDQKMYDLVNNDYAWLKLVRTNFGGDKDIRYPDDPFDRIWNRRNSVNPNITTEKHVSTGVATNKPPSAVMQSAQTTYANSTWRMDSPNYYVVTPGFLYISMYFAELEELNATSIREFNVYLDGKLLYGSFKPEYLQSANISVLKWFDMTSFQFSLKATHRSALSPLLNAFEIYRRSDRLQDGTFAADVEAVTDIQNQFKLKYNSNGDPCLPYNYSWDWLGCSIDPSPARVISLNLSNRGLKGTIPRSIARLSALTSLDLSQNILSGTIPEFLANLTNLKELNLENNNLSGPVPAALSNNNKLSLNLSGNRFPCQTLQKNQCSTPEDKSSSRRGLIIGLVIAAAVGLTLVYITIVVYRSRATRKAAECIPAIRKDFNAPPSKEFTYKEVREITGDFRRQIGRGGFGPVFHGRLHGGLEVAVKVLSEKSRQGSKEFSTEVALLSRVHHKNLVSLLGYCCEDDHQILIYEYMPNGNLRDILHAESKPSNHFLNSWVTRFDIALNAAQGLEYLHTACTPHIIHRDVKPANILLSERMEAKISDFGLSKFGPSSEATHVSTDVKGTFGYLDSEYALTHNLTEKSDVYSFGVVLFEIMSGRSPIDTNISGQQCHIAFWARSLIDQGNVEGIIDRNVGNNLSIAAIWKVAELAMMCTEPRSIDRPTMSEVVVELKEAIRLVKGVNSADYEIGHYASVHLHADSSLNEISSVPFPR